MAEKNQEMATTDGTERIGSMNISMNIKKNPYEKKRRDVTMIPLSEEEYLLVSCDSCGGVGDKEKDLVRVPPEITGYYTSRVAIMEMLTLGGTPTVIIDTLSVEWEPTGKRIYDGIRRFLEEAKLEMTTLNGSTEENFPMVQTAMGITVIGRAATDRLRLDRSRPGHELWLLGVPKVGNEILQPFDPEIASVKSVQQLLEQPEVKDMIPVGSKGIKHEAGLLAGNANVKIRWEKGLDIPLEKSGGPSTCVILSLEAKAATRLEGLVSANAFQRLGKLEGASS
ncbi:AIR synthase related protein [Tindallia californiensis]|uniref:PurM-like N-terminal domain-containing protein n=1 Tax=Tindallia californiensis TaxID=159292 RepID=A0A1H3PJ23_9FIRM|nr:AIR synthase related protein [Tindallia californiensis]SDZ01077.1 hypothetical protein SAMN05192546_106236 [Tindallia californiensis]